MLLEGLEVVFIVITFGDNQQNIGAAVIGAAAAIIVVTIAGIAVKAPLTKVPENWMKFAVGVMLTSFGTFWGAEGAGVAWPGNDAALLVLVPVVALVGGRLRLLAALAQGRRAAPPRSPRHRRLSAHEASSRRSALFWYDFIVGDDWHVAGAGGRGPGGHRDPRPRGQGQRLVAPAGRRLRRPGLVPAPGDRRRPQVKS